MPPKRKQNEGRIASKTCFILVGGLRPLLVFFLATATLSGSNLGNRLMGLYEASVEMLSKIEQDAIVPVSTYEMEQSANLDRIRYSRSAARIDE
jgi:hypothetical protein